MEAKVAQEAMRSHMVAAVAAAVYAVKVEMQVVVALLRLEAAVEVEDLVEMVVMEVSHTSVVD